MEHTEISIIIPAYNEAETIGDMIREIKALYPESEVIVINDGSKDETGKIATEAGGIVYNHPFNIGNGAAIKSGIRIASNDVLVLMDGDGQHDPKDIEKLLEYFPEFDMIVGARPKSDQATMFRGLGNRVLNLLASYVGKYPVMDLTSGFRAVGADIANKMLYLFPNTYSYPTTLTLSVLRSGRSVKYVTVRANVRKTGKSSINLFRDGIKFFMIIARICGLYSPLRIFLPVSFSIFLIGLIYYLYTFFAWGRFTNMSALLFTTSIIIFMMGLISEQISQMRFERSEGDKFL